MKAFIVFAVACLALAAEGRHHGKPDFHWRDFNGSIPVDALKVTHKGGKGPVYIGQGYLEGAGILPGMLVSGVKEMKVVANGLVHTIRDNIKIMATDSVHPEVDFQWIATSYENLDSFKALSFLNVPVGGTENSTALYIGRPSDESYVNIGKIYTLEPYQGLNIADPSGKPTVYKNFEFLAVLNFDCDAPEKSHRMTSGNRFNQRQTSWRL